MYIMVVQVKSKPKHTVSIFGCAYRNLMYPTFVQFCRTFIRYRRNCKSLKFPLFLQDFSCPLTGIPVRRSLKRECLEPFLARVLRDERCYDIHETLVHLANAMICGGDSTTIFVSGS